MKKILIFTIAAAGVLTFLSACTSTTPPSQEAQIDFSAMTPEERENFEALQRAKKRVEEKNKIIPAKSHKGTQVHEKKSPLFERNSVEKRKRLGDPSKPVLLNNDSSVFGWRDDGRRSDKLRSEQQERRESYSE